MNEAVKENKKSNKISKVNKYKSKLDDYKTVL